MKIKHLKSLLIALVTGFSAIASAADNEVYVISDSAIKASGYARGSAGQTTLTLSYSQNLGCYYNMSAPFYTTHAISAYRPGYTCAWYTMEDDDDDTRGTGTSVAKCTKKIADGDTISDFSVARTSAYMYFGGAQVVCPKYKATTFSVTFDSGDGYGTMTSLKGKNYDSSFTLPECTFTNPGYKFAGWKCNEAGKTYEDGEAVTGADFWVEDAQEFYADLVAQWEENNTYTITYKPGSGTPGKEYEDIKEDGVSIKLADALYTLNGVEQVGWCTGSEKNTGKPDYALCATYTKNADLTLYPCWASTKQYTITVNASPTDGGSVYGGGSYNEGETAKLQAIANAGYKFSNWEHNGMSSVDNPLSVKVESSSTYKAKFVYDSETKYTVYYRWNGVDVSKNTYAYGDKYVLPTDYTWYYDVDCTEKVKDGAIVASAYDHMLWGKKSGASSPKALALDCADIMSITANDWEVYKEDHCPTGGDSCLKNGDNKTNFTITFPSAGKLKFWAKTTSKFSVDNISCKSKDWEEIEIDMSSSSVNVVGPDDGTHYLDKFEWTPLNMECRVIFNLGAHGDTTDRSLLTQLVTSGGKVKLPTVTPDQGYEFKGWDRTDEELAKVTSDMVVHAIIEPKGGSYKITYENLQGATNPNPSTFLSTEEVVFEKPGNIEGYTFLGWTPTRIAYGTKSNVTVTAKWEQTSPGEDPEDPEDPEEIDWPKSLVCWKGEPMSEPLVLYIKRDGVKSVSSFTGLPSGLRCVKGSTDKYYTFTISGTPTKAGTFTGKVTATMKKDGSKVEYTLPVIVNDENSYSVSVDYDSTRGKVTGAGVYEAGKKVTLKATASKGYVFGGWYQGGELVSQATSYVIAKMPAENVSLSVDFISSAEDKASIAVSLDGIELEPGSAGAYEEDLWQGVYCEWSVAASALTKATVKVTGLPSGLKFTAKPVTKKVRENGKMVTITNVPANTIYGAPKTGGKTSTAKLTVTTASKSTQTYQLKFTVDALPSWAKGSFVGESYDDDGNVIGKATAVVAANGKVTVKRIVNGKTVSFTATYLDEYDEVEDVFRATVSGKVSGATITDEVEIREQADGSGVIFGANFEAVK